jgi:phosphatidate cytidylyltransferase
MKQRIIFGAIGALIAISAFLYANQTVIALAATILIFMAMYEFFKTLGFIKSKKPLVTVSYIYSACIIGTCVYSKTIVNVYLPFVISAAIISMFVLMVLRHKNILFSDVATAFTGTTYITLFLVCIYLIRTLPDGRVYIWLPFILAWLTDTFAYFVGVFFGKHKLIPSVSPKKTIEGSIGVILGAVLTIVIYLLVCSKITELEPRYFSGIILSLVCSVASQFGDLAASCIKRENNAKDFGSIMPGHGGVMDRFDSVIYISPLVYWFLLNYGIFVH